MTLLDASSRYPELPLEPGVTLLEQGMTSGKLFVVIEGEFSVRLDGVEIAVISEPGALFGEMSLILQQPHMASVTTATPARIRCIDDGRAFLASDPDIMFQVAHLLAVRLQMLTGYLADLKHQYADRDDHLCMVDEVLACLSCQHDGEVKLGSERESGPET